MFLIRYQGNFKDFWINKIGDVFIENTIKGLKLNAIETELIFYHGLESIPVHFRFNQDDSITTLEKVVTIDENGNENITFNDINTYVADVFYKNGNMLQTC